MSPKKKEAVVIPKLEYINVDQLHFDPHNPRLPDYLDSEDETQILDWMLSDASLVELMGSIGEQGYFPGEPLLGYYEDDNTCIIVEGNRRLAAVKLLLHPEITNARKKSVFTVSKEALNKPEELPVFIYNNRDNILAYLGYRHVTGIKEWDPLAKARYVRELFEMQGGKNSPQTYQALAKKIGSRANYVARLLAGYALYEKIAEKNFFKIKELDESSIDFSLLTTATSYSNLTDYLGLKSAGDPKLQGLKLERLSKLVSWLFKRNAEGITRIGESRNLKTLSQIVVKPKALKAWETGASLETASMLTEAPEEIFNTSIRKSQENLDLAMRHVHSIQKPKEESMEILRNIKTIASDVFLLLQNRLKN